MNTTKNILYYLMVIFTITIMACGGGSGGSGGGGNNHIISKVDLTGAVGTIITDSNGSAGQSVAAVGVVEEEIPPPDALFKVTEDGYVLEVHYYNEEGGTFDSNRVLPLRVHKVNSEWAVVTFRIFEPTQNPDDYSYLVGELFITDVYLVRLSDGEAFPMMSSINPINHYGFGPHPCYEEGCWANNKTVKGDDLGNIYFSLTKNLPNGIDWNLKVVKLDMSDLNNLDYTYVTPNDDNHMVRNFDVDKNGNIMFHGYVKESSPTVNFRKISAYDGTLSEYQYSNAYWKGLDGNLYAAQAGGIKKYEIDENYNVTLSNYGSIPSEMIGQVNNFKLEFPLHDKIVLVEACNPEAYDICHFNSGARIVEVYNPTAQPIGFKVPEFYKVKYVSNSDNYYYVSGANQTGENIIAKVDVTDHSYTIISGPTVNEEYFKMNVDSDGNLIVNVRDNLTGKYQMVQIDPTGVRTVLEGGQNISAREFEWLR